MKPPSTVVTVIVVSPTPTAVITPFATVATSVSLDSHITDLSTALYGITVAVNVLFSPK